MKLLIAGAICATALCGAAPALAQPYGRPSATVQPGHDLRQQLDTLERRLQDGIRAGQIDRGEADRGMREVTSIREEQDRMRAGNGGTLSDIDRGRLQERLDRLSRSIHWMREHGAAAGGYGAPPPVAAGPAYGAGAGDWPLERRETWLQERINSGRAQGWLDRREAYRAQRMLNDTRMMQRHMMRRGGGRLLDSDRAVIDQRLTRLGDMLRGARRDEAPPWVR